MSIGVALSSFNRQKVLDETLDAFKTYTPPGAVVVVVDDGSTRQLVVPDWVRLIKHPRQTGIPAAKNRCIAELMDLGVEHLFLFDDDTRPCAENWWVPYCESPEPHLQYSWTHFSKDRRAVPKMDVLYRDSDLIGYGWSMGCLLYAHRSVVDRVGGMDPVFGKGMEEHAEWSQRIHNAGLTTFVHQDHPGMKDLVWAADEHYAVTRSFTPVARNTLLERNQMLRLQRADSDAYVEYRVPRDIVLASYFCGQIDPQRGKHAVATIGPLRSLIRSCRDRDIVILHDAPIEGLPAGHQLIEAPLAAYTQRWISQWRYLRDHPEVRWGWMVDATDTEMVRDPYDLRPGVLYCGWENAVLSCHWIKKHAPATQTSWINANPDRMLMNTGVVGGDRATLMWVCRKMIDLWAQTDRKSSMYEMALFNRAVSEFPGEVVTGPGITSLFKANELRSAALWKHK